MIAVAVFSNGSYLMAGIQSQLGLQTELVGLFPHSARNVPFRNGTSGSGQSI